MRKRGRSKFGCCVIHFAMNDSDVQMCAELAGVSLVALAKRLPLATGRKSSLRFSNGKPA